MAEKRNSLRPTQLHFYEDNAKGSLSDERFSMMSKIYEDEQTQLKAEIVNSEK